MDSTRQYAAETTALPPHLGGASRARLVVEPDRNRQPVAAELARNGEPRGERGERGEAQLLHDEAEGAQQGAHATRGADLDADAPPRRGLAGVEVDLLDGGGVEHEAEGLADDGRKVGNHRPCS